MNINVIEFKNDKMRLIATLFKIKNYKEKHAVNNVSFNIKKGESVAIFGRNGAGKSTILKMITEVCYPTDGEISVKGRVSALLELTSGFDPEFTGRENIYLKGQLLGLKNNEIKELEQEIIDFAEIEEYIDQPEILIVDEALSVGDENFRKKCSKKVNEIIKNEGVTLLFVTHSVGMAAEFCKRGMVMETGKIVFDGNIEDAIKRYQATSK